MNTILRYSIWLFIVNSTLNHGVSFPAEIPSEKAEEENNEHGGTSHDKVSHDIKTQESNRPVKVKESSATTVLNDVMFMKFKDKTKSSSLVNNSKEPHILNMLTEEQTLFVPNKRKLTYQFEKCLFKNNSILRCLFLMHHSYDILYSEHYLSMTNYQQRRLLSVAASRKVISHSVNVAQGTVNGTDNSNTSNSTDRLLNGLTLEEYEEFVKVLRQSFSKDPLHAMLSVCFLMIVLMVAIKMCGLKTMKHQKEIPPEYDGATHYASIYDILKMRRPYLPKKLLRWERRLRRKYKRKKRIMKEQDLADPLIVSDNSAEESLIYSRSLDF